MNDKASWFIRIEDRDRREIFGIGECGPLLGLSRDHRPDFEEKLASIIEHINASAFKSPADDKIRQLVPLEFPSIIFGVETALLDLQNGGKRLIFNNSFTQGKPISINGLIWMGDMDFMMDQINKKIAQGFTCLKLKVGGLDFDRECDILNYIRKRYFRQDIIIRLDANGALKVDEVLYKLGEMARFKVHSIEQPIKPGLDEMEELCRKSPIPVAFDEELIGVTSKEEKIRLLEKLKPPFIVLKPTLHGGLKSCEEWISIAESLKIGWWITSALESSIGLNAICQFAANYQTELPQGLGTGTIYSNNFASPLTVKDGNIFYVPNGEWEVLEV
ncbi:MAG: o-succinylbenzoate synthase [Cyclobacteriaceae bacterium]